jgi:hypothetical protein
MSRHFVLAEDGVGPGGQIYFRRHPGSDSWYTLYLDDYKAGIIMKDSCWGNWNAVSYFDDSEWFRVRSMDGFSRRMAAAEFIIKHHGYWLRNERDDEKSNERAEKFIYNWNMKKCHAMMEGIEI